MLDQKDTAIIAYRANNLLIERAIVKGANSARNGAFLSLSEESCNTKIVNSSISDVSSTGDGGSIGIEYNCHYDDLNLQIIDSTFTNSSSQNRGGVIYNNAEYVGGRINLFISNSQFENCKAIRGGVIFNGDSQTQTAVSNSVVTIINSSFRSNQAGIVESWKTNKKKKKT